MKKIIKPKKIGEIKMECNFAVHQVTFKIWYYNSEYFAQSDNPFLMSKIGRREVVDLDGKKSDLGNLIITINKIFNELNGKIISNTLPKEIMDLATKKAILIKIK